MISLICLKEFQAKYICEYPEDILIASGSLIYDIILIENHSKKCRIMRIDKSRIFLVESHIIKIEPGHKIVSAAYLESKKELIFITDLGYIYSQNIMIPSSIQRIFFSFHPHEILLDLRYHPRKNVIILRTTNNLYFYNHKVEELYKVLSNRKNIELSDNEKISLLIYCLDKKKILFWSLYFNEEDVLCLEFRNNFESHYKSKTAIRILRSLEDSDCDDFEKGNCYSEFVSKLFFPINIIPEGELVNEI